MNFFDVVRNRYSCKKYNGVQISKEQLDSILESGRLAPTAKNLQEQKIYVIQSTEGLAKVDEVTPCRYGAPTVILVAYNNDETFTYPGNKVSSGMEDATIVATHMMLAAKDVGVESCWLNFFNPDDVAKVFGLPSNEKVLMLLDLGYADEKGIPLPNHNSRKALEETVKFI